MFDNRALNWFVSGMLDIQFERYPFSQKVDIVFNDVERDHYQDPILVESSRVNKWAIVRKNPDMNFVQQFGDELLEDYQKEPWAVGFTVTDLPRNPRQDDNIIIGGERFIVSVVKPLNRSVDKVLWALVYPERNDEDDPVKVEDPLFGGPTQLESSEEFLDIEDFNYRFP